MERADSFATLTTLQRQFLSAVLDRLWPKLEWQVASSAVLDVGCGSGDVTALQLLPRLPVDVRVVAADLSDSAIAHAASRFVGPRLFFLKLHIGTRRIQNTAVWRLGPYSKVFSFFSLQWEQRQGRATKNISKLLCSGGETVLVLMSRTGLFGTYANVAKSAKWSSYLKDYQQFLSPYQLSDNLQDDLNINLQKAGLAVKTCNQQEIVYVTEKESCAKETLAAMNPFLTCIPRDVRATFQRDCEEAAFKGGAAIARKLNTQGTVKTTGVGVVEVDISVNVKIWLEVLPARTAL
ncbi:juvenile hormone acid O-methyltransferase-like [Schistocerca piceifrons]|uniref:juvenile hormone acid O-methyltransferase-like n=1 Tax=Schistocerca piceifrons TaxID=274613 RepID=UPI001F5E71A1|nr:juvenile hormone acid O-methyltransferase-like [Schistocerca piceifrons]